MGGGFTANIADLVALRDEAVQWWGAVLDGKSRSGQGGVVVKKHIIRYHYSPKRNNIKPLSTCLSIA